VQKKEKLQVRNGYAQSGESVESLLEKKATVGIICRTLVTRAAVGRRAYGYGDDLPSPQTNGD